MKYPLIYTASRSNEYNTNLYKKVRSELHFGTEGAEEKSAKEFNFYQVSGQKSLQPFPQNLALSN